jgi:hypothetical protein
MGRLEALTFQELELKPPQLIPQTTHKIPVKTEAYLLYCQRAIIGVALL